MSKLNPNAVPYNPPADEIARMTRAELGTTWYKHERNRPEGHTRPTCETCAAMMRRHAALDAEQIERIASMTAIELLHLIIESDGAGHLFEGGALADPIRQRFEVLRGQLPPAERPRHESMRDAFLAGLSCGELGDVANFESWEAAADAYIKGLP